jgi:hypothetical protein
MTKSNSRTCIIYGLVSSENGLIRYVGQTTVNIERRVRQHIKNSLRVKATTHKDAWIKKVIRDGFSIEYTILQENAIWNIDEVKWISKLKSDGFCLVNSTSGGEGSLNAPKELRERISLSVKKIWECPKHREKMRVARSGIPWSRSRRDAFNATPKEELSARGAKGRVNMDKSRRSELSSIAGKVSWDKKRKLGIDRGEHVNSAKLTDSVVMEIRRRKAAGESGPVLADYFGVSQACISKIIIGKTWSHLPILENTNSSPKGESNSFAKLNESQVMEIRRRAEKGERLSDISKDFNMHRTAIRYIVVGQCWKHLPILGYTPNNNHKISSRCISDKNKKIVEDMIAAGMKFTEISANTGIAYHVVRRVSKKLNANTSADKAAAA